jgi:methionine biosynthesis protein MetW
MDASDESAIRAPARADFAAIAEWIRHGSKVLDLGCGDGELLSYLRQARDAHGYGVEIADDGVVACIANRVNVIQSDLETGLSGFGTNSFDYVILSQTLQAMKNSERIISEMLRVGREGIVTFPNFGYFPHRVQVLMGRMPSSPAIPYQWYDTPNIHLCTIDDFENFCATHRVKILERVVMRKGKRVSLAPNLCGDLAVYRFEEQR